MFQSFVPTLLIGHLPVNPLETHERKSVLFHWFSAASCLLRPEVVRSNTVGSPLGGRPGGGAQQHRRKSSWGALLRGKIEGAVGRAMDHRPYRENPSVSTADSSPYRGAFERPHLSDALKFPLQGGMSRSDKGVQQGRAKASDDSQ